MKTRNFIVKIYKRPFVQKVQAKDKKEAEQKAIGIFKVLYKTKNIHKIKVINDTNT